MIKYFIFYIYVIWLFKKFHDKLIFKKYASKDKNVSSNNKDNLKLMQKFLFQNTINFILESFFFLK